MCVSIVGILVISGEDLMLYTSGEGYLGDGLLLDISI